MVGQKQPRRGEVWWAATDKRRPVVVVQADFLNRSGTDWILAVPLTTNLARASYPGNFRLGSADTGLRRPSIANVAQVAPLLRSGFGEKVGVLTQPMMARLEEGLRLVLYLAE